MEKTRRICPRAALCLLLALTLLAAPALAEGARQLVPVGRTVGIEAATEGLLVVSLSEVETAEGKRSPAAECGIQPGDIIVRLGGCEVGTSAEFAQAAAGLDGSPVAVQLLRGEQLIQYTLTPALSAAGAPVTFRAQAAVTLPSTLMAAASVAVMLRLPSPLRLRLPSPIMELTPAEVKTHSPVTSTSRSPP